tara:strand:- start:4449 stop:6344 length:1896 start_codon:yes stop_codon:yes gene_type:complete
MKKCRLSAVAVLCLGSATTVFAEKIDNQEEPVIVTATRTAQTANETLASVTVITRKDIERQQARSIQDALRGVTGISIANNGGPGKPTSVFMRGTESDHVLVLIDGIRAGSVTSGGAAYENIPIEQIERIEIVRGPRSSLYGSEAIGGVIQIFTRKGSRDGFKPSFSLGGGSYKTTMGSVGLAGGTKRGWFNMNVSGTGTSGFNACTGSSSAGCFSSNPDSDRDGYRNVAGSLRAGYRFKNGLEVDANFLRSAGKTEFDESDTFPGSNFIPPNKAELVQQVFGGKIRYSPLDIWRISLIGGRSRDNADNFLGNTFLTKFNSRRDTFTLQNDLTLGRGQLMTIGFDYKNDYIKSTEKYAVTSRNNWGVFAQHQATLAKHDLQLSLRHDDNEQFGSRVTGGAAWGYTLSEKLRLTANFGSAYKAPTFNELYFPGFSNANLKPEDSLSYELGAKGKTGWGSWSLNIYETRIDDLIAFDANTFAPANIDQVRIRGLEGVFKTQIKGWQINTNVTFLDPENRSSGTNRGNTLPRRAEQSFRFDANRQFDKFTLAGIPFGKFTLGAMLLVEDERYDDLANARKLDSYVKFDLRGEYSLNKNWRLQGRVENLFNERYETAAFYNQPGRNFFITLRYQP